MRIREEIETGWPSQTTLHRRVSAYARIDRVTRFKVGITSNSKSRASRYSDEYDEMVVLYQTSSDRHVRQMEADLVAYYEEYSDNVIGGGGGGRGGPPYFLYVVLRRRRRKRA